MADWPLCREQEIHVLSQCACEQLTKYMGSFIYGTKLWIIMEYLAGGSVLDLMSSGYVSLHYQLELRCHHLIRAVCCVEQPTG